MTWAARPDPVLRALFAQGHVVATVIAVPLAVALAEGAWRLAAALAAALAPPLLAAVAASRRPQPRDLRQIEAVAVLVFLFLGVAALAVPAYMALGMGFVDAVFESVSAITSTGLSVAEGTMDWPLAGHALRAWMQWAGGFAIAVAGVALILGPRSARGAARSLGQAGIADRDLLTSTRGQARNLLAVYGAVTAIAIAAFLPLFPTWWEAVAVALTAVSTGGFTPRPDSLASYSRAAQAATMLACLATSFSLMVYVIAKRKGPRRAILGTNAGPMLGLAVLGAALTAGGALLLGRGGGGTADAVFTFLSGVTTAGFSVSPVDPAPPLVALIVTGMVIGGGIGSTAGGIKIDRVMAFLGAVGLALLRLRAPARAVTRLTSNGARLSENQLVAMIAVTILYLASMLVAWMILLMAGQPALPALFDVVSALSTVGLSAGVVSAELADGLKAVLIAAMLLGRLEFLALIAVLSPATWAPKH